MWESKNISSNGFTMLELICSDFTAGLMDEISLKASTSTVQDSVLTLTLLSLADI
jgi:hypothetical protein